MRLLIPILLLSALSLSAAPPPSIKYTAITTSNATGVPATGNAPIFNADNTWHFGPAGGGSTPTFNVNQFGGPVDGTNIISGAIFTNITIRGGGGPTNALLVNSNSLIWSNAFQSLTFSNDSSAAINARIGATNFLTVADPTTITLGYLNGQLGSGTIAGGLQNSNRSAAAFIGSGQSNMIQLNTAGQAIVGGILNYIGPFGSSSYPNFIGGGVLNYIIGSGGVINGGVSNSMPTSNKAGSVIDGGFNNTNTGQYSTIAGGSSNTISGDYAFAAGRRAIAAHNGAFVLSDSQDAPFSSAASDTFNVRAQGGMNLRGGGITTSLLITNAVGANQGTAVLYATGTNGLIYVGTNNPAIANGFINGTNATQIDVPGIPQGALNVHSNGTVYINGSGAGSVVLGNTAHTFNTTVTAPNATAARTLTAPDATGTIVAAASATATPVDGDGTATTLAQILALFPSGQVVTNGFTFNLIGSGWWTNTGGVSLTGATNFVSGKVQTDGGLSSVLTTTGPGMNFAFTSCYTNPQASFTLQAPLSVSGNGTIVQRGYLFLTNNSAAPITVTKAAGVKTFWFGTNVTTFTLTGEVTTFWTCRPGSTNCYVGPETP